MSEEIKKVEFKPGNMLYPVPVAMISCQNEDQKPNIITVAWIGTICSDPAMLSVSIRRERFSYDIIKNSRELVVNLVNKKLTAAADYCGVTSGRDTDKFAALSLTPQTSAHISAPGILESPVNIECQVKDIIPLGSHDLFICQVAGVCVDSRYMDEKGRFRLEDTEPVAYSHGQYYALGQLLGSFGYSVRKK